MLLKSNLIIYIFFFIEIYNLYYFILKRFGLEGCDTFISGLTHFADCCAKNKVEYLIIGMPHRGRINTLCSILKKPAE